MVAGTSAPAGRGRRRHCVVEPTKPECGVGKGGRVALKIYRLHPPALFAGENHIAQCEVLFYNAKHTQRAES
jgi:hypothetical protein